MPTYTYLYERSSERTHQMNSKRMCEKVKAIVLNVSNSLLEPFHLRAYTLHTANTVVMLTWMLAQNSFNHVHNKSIRQLVTSNIYYNERDRNLRHENFSHITLRSK